MNTRIHLPHHPNRLNFKDKAKKELIQENDPYDDDDEELVNDGDNKKKNPVRRGSNGGGGGGGGGGVAPSSCQAEKCGSDLTDAKRYYRRHKVCEFHSKAPTVLVSGVRQRFCQQCSRFHELSEFDDAKRSCRRRLAGHNERRRKTASESHEESSSVNQNGRIPMAVSGNAKHFHII